MVDNQKIKIKVKKVKSKKTQKKKRIKNSLKIIKIKN